MSESMDESVLDPDNRHPTDAPQAISLPRQVHTHGELVDFLLAHATHPQTPAGSKDEAVRHLLQIRTARWEQMNAEA